MKSNLQLLLIFFGFLVLNTSSLQAQRLTRQQRLAQVEEARQKQAAERQKAWDKAAKMGWKTSWTDDQGNVAVLMYLDGNGEPVYYKTYNYEAAQTIRTDELWFGGSLGINLTGDGMDVGVWDGGSVVTDHVTFNDNVIMRPLSNGNSGCWSNPSSHATHVTGTIVGNGNGDINRRGMAPEARAIVYDFCTDITTILFEQTLDFPLLVSNHSYGPVNGWEKNSDGIWEWFGTAPSADPTTWESEDRGFGRYDQSARNYDIISYDNPGYLMFFAAGNDRGNGPSALEAFQLPGNEDILQIYTHLGEGVYRPDGGSAGYDCLGSSAVAKNVVTVGAVEAVTNYTGPNSVVMSSFSGWGPTDDGRIKPDVVANGVDVVSSITCTDDRLFDFLGPDPCAGEAVNTQFGSSSGTSMATPTVTGTAALLQEYYGELNANAKMLAATLKGLLIHTTDEAGIEGPDFQFGWGLVNAERAAQLIKEDDAKNNSLITENTLNNGTTQTFEFFASGDEPIRFTISWTDPEAAADNAGINDATSRLINDLDMRVRTPFGINERPYVKPFGSDTQNATAASSGDNNRDNVEQIYIPDPSPGIYRVTISHKGTLVNDFGNTRPQAFSLIMSGGIPVDENFVRNDICEEAAFLTCLSPATGNTEFTTTTLPGNIPGCSNGLERGVWYTFVGSGTPITVTTDFAAETDFDTQLTIFRGSSNSDPCNTLICVGSNDDISGSLNRRSRVTVNTILGSRYFIYLDGYNNDFGNYKIAIEECPIPPNDLCVNATDISCNTSTYGSTDYSTTFEYGNVGGSGGYTSQNGAWFTFTGTGDTVILSTDNPGTEEVFRPILYLFSGSCGNLTFVKSAGGLFTPKPTMTLETQAGVQYYLFMGGVCIGICDDNPVAAPTGNYELTMACKPANDVCADAIEVTCNTSITRSSNGATGAGTSNLVSCDSDVDYVNSRGVWFTFLGTGDTWFVSTANNAGAINGFDPELTIFTGQCGQLTCINAEDNFATSVNPFLSIPTMLNQRYYVYLDGEGAGEGTYTINFGCLAPNQECEDALTLTCGETIAGQNNYGGRTTNIPNGTTGCGLDFQTGVWFTFQGTGDQMEVSTDFPITNFDTRLRVYEGGCFSGLTCVGVNDDIGGALNLRSRVSFLSTPGTTYFAYLDGYQDAKGTYEIGLSCTPVNDLCAEAVPVSCGEIISGNTLNATASGLSTDLNCSPKLTEIGLGVWYQFSGMGDVVTFKTLEAGTDFDVELLLYEGSCGTLSCLGGSDNLGAPDLAAVTTATETGKTYFLYVNGDSLSRGSFEIEVECAPDQDSDGVADADDQCPDFDDRQDMDGDGIPDYCDNCAGTFTPGFATMDFDSELDFLSIPAYDMSSNTITMEAWVYPNGTQTGYTGIIQTVSTGTKAGLNFRDNNELGYHWSNTIYYAFSSGLIVPANQWSHVALVVEPDKATLYLNGEASVHQAPHVLQAFDEPLLVGRDVNFGTDRDFDGKMDEVRIWDLALTEDQLGQNTLGTVAGNATGLLTYLRFDDGIPNGDNQGLTTTRDYSDRSADATLSNFNRYGSQSNWSRGTPLQLTDVNGNGIGDDCEEVLSSVQVTFRVDMRSETVSPEGVHVAGNFQSEAGFPDDWNPGTTRMTDEDGNGIYEVTLTLDGVFADQLFSYKFINGDQWGQDEIVPDDCGIPGGAGARDRYFFVPTTANTPITTDLVCFGDCVACGCYIDYVATQIGACDGDQRYDFSLLVHAVDGSGTYYLDGDLTSGDLPYDSLNAFPAQGGIRSFTVIDSDDPTCRTDITINPPAGCGGLYECSATEISIDDPNILTGTYSTQSRIFSAGIVEANEDVLFLASESITLEPGFHAKAGSDFIARIDDCNDLALTDVSTPEEHTPIQVIAPPENNMGPGPKLYPNAPNPFREETRITYFLPESVDQATLFITNNLGQRLATMDLQRRGTGQVVWQAGVYPPGLYLYSLVVDGQLVGTFRMVRINP
jgi:hypothetical protein